MRVLWSSGLVDIPPNRLYVPTIPLPGSLELFAPKSCFPQVFVPQEKLRRRRRCRARQRVLDGDEEATLGHTSIADDDTVRTMKANAAPRPLHSSPGM